MKSKNGLKEEPKIFPHLPVTIICGPTAIGKTAFAIAEARRVGGEIISADSGQIYRGLDIGSAKPPIQERQGVSFHLIDILDPNERFSAADFRRLALEKIAEIQSRGRPPFVVGGTGLYLKVLEEGIFAGPAADPEIRKRLEEGYSLSTLYARLKEVDPEAARKIDAGNRQRVVRALEVYELTGRPISAFWREHRSSISPPQPPSYLKRGEKLVFKKIGLNLPREELNRRIDLRVDRMIASGWIEETEELLKRWGPEAPAFKIIGYQEIVSYLRGEFSRENTIFLIQQRTRQLAKRQRTWFRKILPREALDNMMHTAKDLRAFSRSDGHDNPRQ